MTLRLHRVREDAEATECVRARRLAGPQVDSDGGSDADRSRLLAAGLQFDRLDVAGTTVELIQRSSRRPESGVERQRESWLERAGAFEFSQLEVRAVENFASCILKPLMGWGALGYLIVREVEQPRE
jgi:hypothetical protein